MTAPGLPWDTRSHCSILRSSDQAWRRATEAVPILVPIPVGKGWRQTLPALYGRQTHLHQIRLLLTVVAPDFNKFFMDSCRNESHERSRLPLLYLYLINPVVRITKYYFFTFASGRHPGLSCPAEADDFSRRGSGWVLLGLL